MLVGYCIAAYLGKNVIVGHIKIVHKQAVYVCVCVWEGEGVFPCCSQIFVEVHVLLVLFAVSADLHHGPTCIL